MTAATVQENWRVACYGVTFEDGHSAIYKKPLSDEELAAWRRHPDSFFGVVEQRSANADTPLQVYDFLYESFKRESKDRLLEVMTGAPDYERLTNSLRRNWPASTQNE